MRLYVPLTRDEIAKLQALAARERRHPQEQAAHLLARALANTDETRPPTSFRTPLEASDGAA